MPEDRKGLVNVQAVTVPSTDGKQAAYRIHLRFTPNLEAKVHWTNDAGPLRFFPQHSNSYMIHHLENPSPPRREVSAEARSVEFELRVKSGQSLPDTIAGAAYYYVCEDVDGTCLFLRKPVEIRVSNYAKK